jgi:hypothetical protein
MFGMEPLGMRDVLEPHHDLAVLPDRAAWSAISVSMTRSPPHGGRSCALAGSDVFQAKSG